MDKDIQDLIDEDSSTQFMLLLDEPTRNVMHRALAEFVDKYVGSSTVTAEDLQVAMDAQDLLASPDSLP